MSRAASPRPEFRKPFTNSGSLCKAGPRPSASGAIRKPKGACGVSIGARCASASCKAPRALFSTFTAISTGARLRKPAFRQRVRLRKRPSASLPAIVKVARDMRRSIVRARGGQRSRSCASRGAGAKNVNRRTASSIAARSSPRISDSIPRTSATWCVRTHHEGAEGRPAQGVIDPATRSRRESFRSGEANVTAPSPSAPRRRDGARPRSSRTSIAAEILSGGCHDEAFGAGRRLSRKRVAVRQSPR